MLARPEFRARRYNGTVLERVAQVMHRYNMLERSLRLGVAVSGGADSVCLLHLLADLAPQWDLRLSVLHVNHQLRGAESDGDAQFVAELAARLGLPFLVHLAPVAPGDNLEQAARDLRLAFFRSAARDLQLARVATAHTADDQAETVLFRFLRGSGAAGLSGIRPVTTDGLIRPLLETTRTEIEQYLRGRSIAWREDSTNHALDFARNRIRHELLPQLEREWNPGLRETLLRTADWARAEEAYWADKTAEAARDLFVSAPGAILVPTGALRALPLALARRLVRHAMEQVKGDLRGVGFAHVEAVLALTASTEGHGRVQTPGLDIFRSFEWLRFGVLGEYSLETRDYETAAALPGLTQIPAAHVAVVMELIDKGETISDSSDVYNSDGSRLDCDRLSGDLRLRNWRPGDQYRPQGALQAEKIKSFFQSARIPIWERRHWPVLTDGPKIVWSRRFGAAAEFAANAGSKRVLLVRESK